MSRLSIAAAAGHLEVVAQLVSDMANVDHADVSGARPLHHAAAASHLGIVRMLVGAGADVRAAENDGLTPLHVAALSNSPDYY